MKYFVFIVILSVIFIAQIAEGGGWSWPPEKSFTLSEFSKAPGVKIKTETFSKPDETFAGLPMVHPSADHPIKRVTMLIFPNATFFTPLFFKNLYPFAPPKKTSSPFPSFSSGLKVHLVVAGPDKAVLSFTPLVWQIVSDADTPELHIKIEFSIAADLMENSYLLLNEEFPRSGGQMIPVYFGSQADLK